MFVTTSTISLFCKKIGYIGYNDFKDAYLEEDDSDQSHFNDIDPNHPFEFSNSVWTISNKIHSFYEETISDTLSLLNIKNLAINDAYSIYYFL